MVQQNTVSKCKVSVQETIRLLTNCTTIDDESCDSTDNFWNSQKLPEYYDAEKFQRGQHFFHKYLMSMLLGKFLGLLSIISTPSILDILIFTRKSGTTLTAYKRYLSTIFHMIVWYEDDFKPNSALWNSIITVKRLHDSASNKSCKVGGGRILQKDMGITQFGFMGFILTRPEMIGIHYCTREELEGFVHIWRVIGHIMGIEDRYNICRDSIDETKEICEALIEKVFIPNIRRQNPRYLVMADALITGMWVMVPILETKAFMSYLYHLLNISVNNNEIKLPNIPMNLYQRFIFALTSYYMYFLRYTILRWYVNLLEIIALWLMRNFPFLAFYKFGYNNSYVSLKVKYK